MLAAGLPADRFEQVVRVEVDDAAGLQAAVEGLGDLRRGPDQDVGVPDGRDAEFRVGADFDPDVADMVLDRRERGFLARLKNGRSIVSRWSRIGMSAKLAANRSGWMSLGGG